MRLIDADLAAEKLNDLAMEPDYQHEGEDWRSGLYMAESVLDELNTNEIALGLGQAIAYEEGYKVGKQAGIEAILEELDKCRQGPKYLNTEIVCELTPEAEEKLKRILKAFY